MRGSCLAILVPIVKRAFFARKRNEPGCEDCQLQ